MLNLVCIAGGGATGALLRYWMAGGVHAWLGRDFPYGTLVVNLLGSTLMGVAYVLVVERMALGPLWRSALLVGLLGAFTTFSTFSIETLDLLQRGHALRAALNVLASVVLCIGGCWAGMVATRGLGA